jgi:hypothetical protein
MNRFWEVLEGVADVAVIALVTLTTVGWLVVGHM